MRTREELLNLIQRATAADRTATKEDHDAISAFAEIFLDIRDLLTNTPHHD
jgi:hypothetical protein